MGVKAEENTEVAALDEDLFSAGFDEAIDPTETKEEESAESAPEVDVKPEEPAAPEVETPAAKVETPAAKVETPAPVDVHALVAAAVEAATKVEPAKADTPETPAPSAEELAAEEQYRKDWPEHAAREDRMKAELVALKDLLTTTVEALKTQIQPVIETASASAQEKHYNTIAAKHPDADNIIDDVEKWIETQPKFLQPQYTKVLESGTASDVIELFDTYKEATKTVVPDPKPEVDKTKEDRLKRMEVPTTLRTSVTAEPDPEDFDGAFEQEAKRLAA